MKTYHELLRQYRKDFIDREIPEATIKAFLFELCNEEEVDLYMELDREAKSSIETKFHEGVKLLLEGKPMNYVLGYCWFFGYRLNVNGDVLIPRYETEELVGLILSKIDEHCTSKKEITIADIGTGSGAIAITLAKEEPRLIMWASDISKEALEVAKKNAKENEAKVTFLCGDMVKPLIEEGVKLDILVSNPPYIPKEEQMERSVIDYEPHVALFGGEDGLYFYRSIFEDAPSVMKEGGMMFFEMGYNQREALTKLALEHFPDAHVEVVQDINGKDRMLYIHLS